MNQLRLLREELQKQHLDGILITSPFNRRYLSGFTGSAGFLLITEEKSQLITDFRYYDQATEQAPNYELIRPGGTILQASVEKMKQLKLKRLGFEKQYTSFAFYEELKSAFDGELVGIQGIVEALRIIKSPEELETIKQACTIADKAFEHIVNFIKPGLTEIEVALELEFYMRKLGATATSFDTIVASGYRSALPHGVASDKIIQKGELVTLDFGAIYRGYASDITRTVAVGEVSDKLRDIYNTVLTAQLAGVSQIKAGMTGKEADAITRNIIKDAGYGENFGHSTGHGIGLEVHEGPGLSSKGDIILRAGMVVTVEPGIYISQLGGVRIEDDVVITDNGCEKLTHSTKDLIIIT